MQTTKNILFVCHRHPFQPNGGAEKSVSIIIRYLRDLGHKVTALVIGTKDEVIDGINVIGGGIDYQVKQNDIVFTWGSVAKGVADTCIENKTPYVLMVRWWRNVVDVSNEIGNLMERSIPQKVRQRNQPIFDNAKAVITNNKYSADVIEKHYNTKALVSYVPIEGEAKKIANPKGYITIISPDKNIGERQLILDLARQMPNRWFLVVNAPNYDLKQYARVGNIKVIGRRIDMCDVWRQTKIVVSPVYKNDICGTLRVNIEAQQHGVPVIASDRCGMWEQIPNLVNDNAPTLDWCKKIVQVERDYKIYSEEAIENFNNYDTAKQLQVFKSVL
jgi:glycosyltransferase involved in cell wall biosynthesis